MTVDIEYGENIIVAVIFRNSWHWYVTEKDYWFLDLVKLENAYLNRGYQLPNHGDYSDRFNIAVLDENSAKDFLDEISEFRVNKSELSDLILKSKDVNTEGELHLAGLTPSLIVDFDSKRLLSYFPEPASFESYAPDGWIGKYENFLDEVPVEEKYWIINSKDYFAIKF